AGVGRQLAGAALVAAEEARPLEPGLDVALRSIDLPLCLPEPEVAARELEVARTGLEVAEARVERGEFPGYAISVPRAMAGWPADYLAGARHRAPEAAPFTIQAIRIGDAAIVATSGETFVAIGQQIQAASPFPDTVVLGYSNGCLGYIPTAAAFPEGG